MSGAGGDDLQQRLTSDTSQNLYIAHNTAKVAGEQKHCMCPSCTRLRERSPRLAAAMDGEIETARRAFLYRSGRFD